MRRVLIPTDFSANAWNAIEYTLNLFRDQFCTFYLLNTYTPAIPHSRFMAPIRNGLLVEDAVRIDSQQRLDKTLRSIKKRHTNHKHRFELISSFNLLIDEMVNAIDTFSIDLVVTGTKGASGIDEVFMGSNTVRMIKNIKNCPVLAIPQKFNYRAPQEIAFATDFNRFYSATELMPLIEMAQTFNAVLRIVHVQYEIKPLSEIQQFNMNMLRKYLKGVEHFIHTVSELNSVSRTLEIFSQELGIHLLAMLNYHHSYMEKMVREPIVKRTAFHTQIPLLVIPELEMYANSRPEQKKARVY